MTAYLDALAPLLPAHVREQALADLRDAFADGLDPATLPDPAEYAAEFTGHKDADDAPTSHVLGLPADIRGLTDGAALSRTFDPTNPNLLVPRTIGIGWDVNFGALAVKLGLLRPDDVDADVIAAIPASVRTAARALPLALAGITALGALTAAHRSPASRIPFSFTAAGQPRQFGRRVPVAAGLTAGATLLAAWGATAPADTPIRPALASGLTALTAGQSALLHRWTRHPERAHRGLAAVTALSPLAVTLAAAVLPIRAGLSHVTKARP